MFGSKLTMTNHTWKLITKSDNKISTLSEELFIKKFKINKRKLGIINLVISASIGR